MELNFVGVFLRTTPNVQGGGEKYLEPINSLQTNCTIILAQYVVRFCDYSLEFVVSKRKKNIFDMTFKSH